MTMGGWRLARSLDVLRAEVRAEHPGTRVDTIGDQSHASGSSDHNENAASVVCAADFFANAGLDLGAFAGRVVASGHPALKYVIFNRRIWSVARARESWRTYTGPNPHATHVHVSVGIGPDGRSTGPYDNTSSWGFEGDDMSAEDVVKGLHLALTQAANPPAGTAGQRGRQTRDALRAVVGIEATNAPELQAALAPLVTRLAALEARPPVQAGPVDTEALMAALEPALRAAAVAGAAEAVRQVLGSLDDTDPAS